MQPYTTTSCADEIVKNADYAALGLLGLFDAKRAVEAAIAENSIVCDVTAKIALIRLLRYATRAAFDAGAERERERERASNCDDDEDGVREMILGRK